jgi:hypothetical protein
MRTTRILMAAIAAAMLSTAAFAVPPSADQVSVPAGATSGRHEGKMKELFSTPEEFMMFKAQMREATKGMARKDKKVWRKTQFQKVRAMNDSEKNAWRKGLDAQWAALPVDRRSKMEAHMQRHEEKHAAHIHHNGKNGAQQDMSQQPPQQQ